MHSSGTVSFRFFHQITHINCWGNAVSKPMVWSVREFKQWTLAPITWLSLFPTIPICIWRCQKCTEWDDFLCTSLRWGASILQKRDTLLIYISAMGQRSWFRKGRAYEPTQRKSKSYQWWEDSQEAYNTLIFGGTPLLKEVGDKLASTKIYLKFLIIWKVSPPKHSWMHVC